MINHIYFYDPDWEYDHNLYALPGKGPSALCQLNEWASFKPQIISINRFGGDKVSEQSDVRRTAGLEVWYFSETPTTCEHSGVELDKK